MAIFKAPRITTGQRMGILLEESEIVFDTDIKNFYGGDGLQVGGFPIGSGASSSSTQTVVLTQANIDNKYITLNSSPMLPNNVSVEPVGGILQVNGIDFEVTGNILSWDGLGLDNFLELNEVLIIRY